MLSPWLILLQGDLRAEAGSVGRPVNQPRLRCTIAWPSYHVGNPAATINSKMSQDWLITCEEAQLQVPSGVTTGRSYRWHRLDPLTRPPVVSQEACAGPIGNPLPV